MRRQARLQPLVELLELILSRTRLDSLYAAKAGGQSKRANLQAFYQLAADFEANGRRDLEQFLEHLDSLEDKGLVTDNGQNAPNAVTIMSIHKSKGLEFPVVFVCGLSRSFNRESVRAQVLCDQTLGLGLVAVDAVILTDPLQQASVSKVILAAKRVRIVHKYLIYLVFGNHTEHRKVPGIDA